MLGKRLGDGKRHRLGEGNRMKGWDKLLFPHPPPSLPLEGGGEGRSGIHAMDLLFRFRASDSGLPPVILPPLCLRVLFNLR